MRSTEQSKVIAAVARDVLRPLGLSQEGRSRTWLDDRTWWLGIVEFQPSSWSKGTYLNVGVCWLWAAKENMSFDVIDGNKPWVDFRDASQFQAEVATLARRAAREVVSYRDKFDGVSRVADFYVERDPKHLWDTFHAGIACGLAGRSADARRFLDRACAVEAGDPHWVAAAARDAVRLAQDIDDHDRFTRVVADRVRTARASLRLPTRACIDFHV